MDNLKITTDHKWKQLKYGCEIPKNVRDDYDHLSEEEKSDGWIKYRKSFYHLSDFLRTKHFPGWNGYHSDSYFSGVLIEISDDGESYRIGRYYS